ncbi:unnamed protein product [Urochloa humidicola]
MDRDPPIPFGAGTPSGSPMIRAATTSPMLTRSSSSTSTQFHRRYYPSSLYPPPLPTTRLVASGSTSTGTGTGYGYGSASRFQLPPPLPPRTAVHRPVRPITTTRSLPTPFLTELAKIRTVGSTLFGDLDALAPSPATRRGAALLGGNQQNRQPWTPLFSSTTTLSAAGGKSYSVFPPPLPSAAGIGMAPPLPTRGFSAYSSPSASQPLSSSARTPSWASTGMPSLTNPRFSGTGGILPEHPPSWASQQQQQQQAAQPWSTADLAALSSVSGGSGIFTTGSALPSASQLPAKSSSSFTNLAPLPGGCGFSGLTPRHTNESTMFGSSSLSPAEDMAPAASDTTMYYGQVQTSLLDSSDLPPLPPSLQKHMEDQDLAPSFWQQSSGNNNSYGTETAASAYTATGSEEPRLQVPTHHRLQVVKEEPVVDDIDAPCRDREPVFIALDDDDEKILSALLESFESSGDEPAASLTNQPPLSSDGWLGDVEGSGQSWDLEAMLLQTPPSTGAASASSSIIPSMNYDGGSMSMSQQQQQQQIPPQQGDLFSDLFSDISQHWQLSENNTSSGFVQPQPNQQIPLLPSSKDSLQLNHSNHIPSIWNTGGAGSSGQRWAGLPALSNMLHTMNIGQGGTATMTAAADQYGMLDFGNSGSSSSAWDQMGTAGGGMSIGEDFPATPAPMFDSNGSSNAWESMSSLNFSSPTTMESSIPSVPKLRLGGMERPSRMPRWTPSLPAGASSSGMSRRGACGDFFSVADMAMINKDKRLKEMVSTDPKRVNRILNNRASVAKLKAQRHDEFLDLS